MNACGETLTEFGRNLGLADFRWPNSGVAVFEFATRGTLYLEEQDDNLLIYLARSLDIHQRTPDLLKTALRLCHYQNQWPCAVQVGLWNESQLMFLARLSLCEVALPELERTLEMLTRLQELCVERL